MKSPLLELLSRYKDKNRISFFMPGHKNGRGIPEEVKNNFFGIDVTELADTEDLHSPGDVLKKSQQAAAEFFGADESFFLVNGSTSGIFTMLMSCCERGDKVLINRRCHASVINACITMGLIPVFAKHEIIQKMNCPDSVSVCEIENILKKEKVSAIFVTSPDVYGFVADIKGISELADKYNVPLLVDEAHGAHFMASEKIFPKTALSSGADMCVQSAHKTLNSPNQTSYLHIKSKKINYERARKAFGIFQTTSPCYPLVAAADEAWRELRENGEKMWSRVHKSCMELREELKDLIISPDRTWVRDCNFADIDECRLTIDISEYEMTGFELCRKLREKYNIDIEMAELDRIVLIPTPSNSQKDFDTLKRALKEILTKAKKREKVFSLEIPKTGERVILPDETFFKAGEICDIKKAEGRISKALILPYPPGIPLVVPGERITREMIDYLVKIMESGAEVHGVSEWKTEVVKEDKK